MKPRRNFRITGGKGFHLTFENGLTLSTQFGAGNYCERHDLDIMKEFEGIRSGKVDVASDDCEIAVWDAQERWITSDVVKAALGESREDQVEGYVSFINWLKVVEYIKNMKAEEVHEPPTP